MSFIRYMLRLAVIFAIGLVSAQAHVVTQLYGEWQQEPGSPWRIEVLFEAGYAVPEIREDPAASAPERDWLVAQDDESWEDMRLEAERYFRECLEIRSGEKSVAWSVEFPDFSKSPPDFPVMLNNGAYFRMIVRPERATTGPVTLLWKTGERPTFILKATAVDGGYVSLDSGDQKVLGELAPTADPPTHGAVWTSFVQGYRHVIPEGWDHVLFVLGLFFYRRKWLPLLHQSLAFTAAHTVTLGLAAAGIVKVSGNWVEPVIALSLVAVALENLRPKTATEGRVRLAIVFGFGLIHGLGFAGALSTWLKPGEGFFTSLLAANVGVEAAQATLLAGAWCLTLGWSETRAYRMIRVAVCLGIAGIGAYWAIERVGWI